MPSVCLSFAVLQILVSCGGSTTFIQNLTDGSENHQNHSNIKDLMSPAVLIAQIQDQQNRTSNRTELELGLFSNLFGFREIAGKRVFSPEQEMESRIIGGQESWAHSWPWQVSLQFATMPACGGAIISPLWVLSAAHCFKRYNKAAFWTVLAGKHDLDNPHEAGQQVVGVSGIINHHHYNTRTKENDLSLLRLQQPLLFNHLVRPIDIWTGTLPSFSMCTITGWGSTRENGPRVNRLQEVNVTVLPPETCDQYYLGRIRPSMFCAGRDQGGVDACQGDSGGPLSCFTGSRYELAGLVSWGVGCGRSNKPGVYTKLQQNIHWMSDIMNDQNRLYEDVVESQEDQCGKQQRLRCVKALGLADLSPSDISEALVGNVEESCPFFWPWQVSLQSNTGHYCSGTLIHRRWVLTAQHCNVRAKEDVVVLGVHDLSLSSQTIPVDEVFSLPDDGSFPPNSDLSLLRLSMPVRFTSNISPVCVPDEDEELNDSWSCVTTGWGSAQTKKTIDPNRLHHVGLSLVNETSCGQRWGGGLIQDSHVCSHPAGSSSCMGDSGAPLLCQKHGTYFLFGMVTWGSRWCGSDKPAVFSKVSHFHPWISEQIEDL
ncbi:ovochymase-1 isoform X1 [Takifugu flavidus]|uniref:ovochymase-1 isoform X1 n=1 Tax=Takifugu flavidus TaxID=433684 RepID=UPI002544B0C5|nr:ovochymase-1 isoform X1 [Takifugu flavidus]